MALQQARAKVGRAANVRANYYTPNVVITIAGSDKTSSVQHGTLQINTALNEEPDTASFVMVPTALAAGIVDPYPAPGNPVYVSLGASPNYLFGGTVTRVSKSYQPGIHASGSTLAAPFVTVECVDWQRSLNAKLVTQEWRSVSATTIARAIISSYASGFTSDAVQADLDTVDQFVCVNEPAGDALARLATLVRGGCYVDASKVVHLFGAAGETSVRYGTTPTAIGQPSTALLMQFAQDRDGTQIRTRATVEAQSTRTLIATPGGATSSPTGATVSVDYLLCAGGAGGAGLRGGGGGGGGVLTGTVALAVGTYAVTVGTGGGAATNGNDSTWNGLTAVGGGKGGTNAGSSGGSGGGGSNGLAGGAGTAGQGYAGGQGDFTPAGGGGGGAGGVGASAVISSGGKGGNGYASSISGTLTYYGAGGGGNGDSSSGAGGTGGGGNGGAGGNPGSNGTGVGAGGGGGATYTGANGQVLVSYVTGSCTATGGTITTAGVKTIHTFTSNGTFEITSATSTATVTAVTDLPIDNRARLDAAGGTVRIGSVVTTYTGTVGPTVADGDNAPGSTLSADVAVGATSLTVVDGTPFSTSYGWAKVGDQVIRYGSRSSTTISGIPASGFGALTAALKANTTITPLGAIRLSDAGITFDPPLKSGETVVQRVTVDDTTAQTQLALVQGGDGIIEHVISDDTLTVDGARTRATQELAAFSSAVQSMTWQTRDLNAAVGRRQSVSFDTLSTSLTITRVALTFPSRNGLPLRQCEAATVRTAGVFDAIVTTT